MTPVRQDPSSGGVRSSGPVADERYLPAVRSAALALLAAVAGTWSIGWSVLTAPPAWVPASDTAIMVLRSLDTFTRHTPLLGMPTTLSAAAGTQLHHPGPLELWLLALPSSLPAPLAPLAAIALVNATAAIGIVWWARRSFGVVMGLVVGVALGASTWPLRGDVLADPYNPYAALLPFAAFLVAVVAVLERRRWAAPLAVVAGTYAAQSHLALFGLVAGVTIAASAVALLRAVGALRAGRPLRITDTVRSGPALTAGAATLALWAPVLVDQLAATGNLGGLLGASGPLGDTLGWTRAARVVGSAIGPWPVWTADQADVHLLLGPVSAAEALGAATVVVAAVVGAIVHRRRHPTIAAAVVVAVGCLATGLALVSRVPDTLFNAAALHNYLWLWPSTLLLWGAVTAAVVVAIVERTAPAHPRLGAAAGVLIALGLVVHAATGSSVRPMWPTLVPAVRPLAAQVTSALDRDGTYLVDLSGDIEANIVASGLVLALERDGFDVVVDDRHAASFGEHRARRDRVLVGSLAVVVRRAPVTADDGPGTLLASKAPPDEELEVLAAAQAPLRRSIERRGGLVLDAPRRFLPTRAALRTVDDGSIVGALQFGLLREPDLAPDDVERLLVAEGGWTRYVGVFLSDGARSS